MRRWLPLLLLLLYSTPLCAFFFTPAVNFGKTPPKPGSIIFNGSTQYLNRTPSVGATSAQKWTSSFWFKRSALSGLSVPLVQAGNAGAVETVLFSHQSGTFEAISQNGSIVWRILSSNASTDTTTWHHFLWAVDTTQATATLRMRLYLDAAEVTYALQTEPSQNYNEPFLNANGQLQTLGGSSIFGSFYPGKFARTIMVDSLQLTPSSFVTGAGAGTTHPIDYTGTLGNNGYRLNYCSQSNLASDDGTGALCGFGGSNNWGQNNSPTWSSDTPQ